MQVSVLIPYYQRAPGLLLRAVRSVLAQTGPTPHIIVIDDASPHPAESDLAALAPEHAARVTVIRQPNAGPAAARNRGLDALPPGTAIVAFLDSDDEWHEHHLAIAAAAFDAGADFYFADYTPPGTDITRFARAGLRPDPEARLPVGQDLFWYTDDLFDLLLRNSPVLTSTVAYRLAAAPGLRFDATLRVMEDILFWLEIAARTRRIVFSTNCEVRCGHGANIAADMAFGDPRALRYLLGEAGMHRRAAARFPLTADQRAWQGAYRDRIRRGVAANRRHALARRQPIDGRAVAAFARAEPGLAPALLRVIAARLTGRHRSAEPPAV